MIPKFKSYPHKAHLIGYDILLALGVFDMNWLEYRVMVQIRENHAKPWIRLPMTFTEIFPVGLPVSMKSTATLYIRTDRVG